VIFDCAVKWDLNVRVMAWVAMISRIQALKDYVFMQCIKGSSTVRCGTKGDKPSSRIVYRYGSQNCQIKRFLETQEFINECLRRMKR
jgi:hypothetical protein